MVEGALYCLIVVNGEMVFGLVSIYKVFWMDSGMRFTRQRLQGNLVCRWICLSVMEVAGVQPERGWQGFTTCRMVT